MVKDKHDGNHLSQEAELDKGGLCTPVPKCRQYTFFWRALGDMVNELIKNK